MVERFTLTWHILIFAKAKPVPGSYLFSCSQLLYGFIWAWSYVLFYPCSPTSKWFLLLEDTTYLHHMHSHLVALSFPFVCACFYSLDQCPFSPLIPSCGGIGEVLNTSMTDNWGKSNESYWKKQKRGWKLGFQLTGKKTHSNTINLQDRMVFSGSKTIFKMARRKEADHELKIWNEN